MAVDIGIFKVVGPPAAAAGSARPAERAGREVGVREVQPAQAKQDGKEANKPSEQLEEMVSDLNELVHDLHRELRFTVDEVSGDTVIKVIDSATDEVVRQIPSEELMRLRKHLKETAGVIFQDSA